MCIVSNGVDVKYRGKIQEGVYCRTGVDVNRGNIQITAAASASD